MPGRVIQKFNPSLHAPNGRVPVPVENVPTRVKSDAFHNDTLSPVKLATNMRSPSNAACCGPFNPLPVKVASTVPASPPVARTTVTLFELKAGTQIFVPSKAGGRGLSPTSTDLNIAPVASSWRSLSAVPEMLSVTQMFAPS